MAHRLDFLESFYPNINNIRGKKSENTRQNYIQIYSSGMQVKIFNPDVSYRKPVVLLDAS